MSVHICCCEPWHDKTWVESYYVYHSCSDQCEILARGYKKISCSTQLSMKVFLPINVKMPTTVGILTCMSRKNIILGLSEPEKCWVYWHFFYTFRHLKLQAQLSWAWKKFYNLGPLCVPRVPVGTVSEHPIQKQFTLPSLDCARA